MVQIDQQIASLRARFLQKLESEGAPEPDGFHAADISRVKNSDDWLRRFIVHNDNNENAAFDMLWDTCDWRKKYGTNDIADIVKRDYLECGFVYTHGTDVDGRSLLIFNCKKHVKGQGDNEELKKCVVYWMERLQRLDKGKPISVFFDMTETGLSNLDMDLVKYIIMLFKSYYPEFLNYIIVFEMPWILNAAFKIIKSWLPAKAVQSMKTVNKASLKDVVPQECTLKAWGGIDDYEFVFVPEQRSQPHEKTDENKKKVHFADGSPTNETFLSVGDTQQRADTAISSALVISPADTINFAFDGTELTGSITLMNTDEGIISYKVKTTSPEKFRVRPSTGTLMPSASVSISITLQPGYQAQGLSREKFLIMSLPVESGNMSPTELADLWRQAAGKPVCQHRLKCHIPSSSDSSARNGSALTSNTMDIDQQVKQFSSSVSHLSESQLKLYAEVKFLKKLHILLVIMVLFFGTLITYLLTLEKQYGGQHCYKQ
ncbi:motile sperm domain-containing protein 2-like [Schistocerca americana]|uniref:motile sperm domain-containing protein 2-like n=1 Tax=Schistocerca americana TaxID=7009 RepID=UPI001F4F3E26|nr:motile sperm domain-containing protein 2-like [Schistocerca americana]XP_049961378.1 motile sperm domain-containing protein 2-like [Schistocerca serialis cubense]